VNNLDVYGLEDWGSIPGGRDRKFSLRSFQIGSFEMGTVSISPGDKAACA
jgi:hypothetical protein